MLAGFNRSKLRQAHQDLLFCATAKIGVRGDLDRVVNKPMGTSRLPI